MKSSDTPEKVHVQAASEGFTLVCLSFSIIVTWRQVIDRTWLMAMSGLSAKQSQSYITC